MSAVESGPGVPTADPSLINPEFIRRLQEQRMLHKREVTFHLAQAEKYGAADEALASMIEAAEKIVAILFPAPTRTTGAPDEATATEEASGRPGWAETTMAVVEKDTGPLTCDEPPATHGPGDFRSDDRADDDRMGKSGNAWRERLLGSRA